MAAVIPPFDISADPLIAEAKQRARRRRLFALAAAGLIAAGLLAFELAPSGSGGGVHGTIPWLSAKPDLGSAHLALAPPCTASQLRATLGMQGVNSYTAAGGISIVNRSATACSLTGQPALSVPGAPSALRVGAMRKAPWTAFDPLAPPLGSLRALRPGQGASVELLYGHGLSCASSASVRSLLLRAPGGGRIRLVGERRFTFPRCAGTLNATHFTPVLPPALPSSALPLRVRIVSSAPSFVVLKNGKRVPAPAFTVHPGTWLRFSVVLTNVSQRPYVFGRTCPAYTESWFGHEASARAYVLNCHPVGSIAPGQSARFAMQAYVPRIRESYSFFTWTLAPHTYHPPAAGPLVNVR